MNRILLILTYLFITQASFACMNEYRTNLDGSVQLMQTHRGIVYYHKLNQSELLLDSVSLWNSYLEKDADSIEYLSDYAATLVYLAHYDQAKNIYFQIENTSPNRYTTASNLGTTYELLGQPDSALFWIKRSMKLNPKSHGGSEWIHVKILEAQIKGTTENSASILGLDFGTHAVPINARGDNLDDLVNDIDHQLSERLKFVDAPNKTVGNIYYDYGNLMALTSSLESAIVSYFEAERFGFDSELMQIRKAEFQSRTKFTSFKGAVNDFIKEHLILSLILFLVGLIFSIWVLRKLFRKLKKWKVKKSN
ncbi:MAG: hypothetical protein GQ574_00695 [Crocinitomix sp.]|nr:hypothetical protein [Crocinitomix sp.]